jgi:hypothetical protein
MASCHGRRRYRGGVTAVRPTDLGLSRRRGKSAASERASVVQLGQRASSCLGVEDRLADQASLRQGRAATDEVAQLVGSDQSLVHRAATGARARSSLGAREASSTRARRESGARVRAQVSREPSRVASDMRAPGPGVLEILHLTPVLSRHFGWQGLRSRATRPPRRAALARPPPPAGPQARGAPSAAGGSPVYGPHLNMVTGTAAVPFRLSPGPFTPPCRPSTCGWTDMRCSGAVPNGSTCQWMARRGDAPSG